MQDITKSPPAAPPPQKAPNRSPVAASPLIQRLPWDFKTTFPEPTEQALEAGTISDEDNHPENIKAIHEEHVREALAVLHDLDAVLDARRRGIDPATGKPPRTHGAKEKLRRRLESEPGRLEHAFEILMDVYADAFGDEARGAFEKAIRAWHAGVEVVADRKPDHSEGILDMVNPKPKRTRPSSALPVPRPLRSSVAAGVFGVENGKPINPSPDEVRDIMQQRADKMMEMDEKAFAAAVTECAEDFGQKAAAQLERHVRHQRDGRGR